MSEAVRQRDTKERVSDHIHLFFIFYSWTVSCLSSEFLNVPIFFLEDVHVSGILADICKIPRLNIPRFVRKYNRVRSDQKYFVYHYSNAEKKTLLYNTFKGKKR